MPGYHHQTEEEIAQDAQRTVTPVQEEEEKEQQRTAGPSLAAGVEACDTLHKLIDWVGNPVADQYENVRLIRMQIMKLQQEKKVQLKISSLLKHCLEASDFAQRQRIQQLPPHRWLPLPLPCLPPLQQSCH